ncbi:MAG: hypothetical protein M3Q23_11765 [Actinomycetota bacterium]|nr:hypothetical protein [Actinomycetota bacterium]
MKGRPRELRATTRRSGTGRGALVAGLAVGSAYVLVVAAGSWLHAGLGVPLLDGFAPPVAYRWVSPPPSLAAGNQPPVAQRFTITMGKRGSDPQVISTIDLQATLVLNSAEIPPRTGSTPVELDVTPLAASDVGRLPGVLVVAGNVYRFTAQYKGDGKVGPLRRSTPVTLVYPATPATGHVEHAVVWSSDGHAWKKLETRDSRKGQIGPGLDRGVRLRGRGHPRQRRRWPGPVARPHTAAFVRNQHGLHRGDRGRERPGRRRDRCAAGPPPSLGSGTELHDCS